MNEEALKEVYNWAYHGEPMPDALTVMDAIQLLFSRVSYLSLLAYMQEEKVGEATHDVVSVSWFNSPDDEVGDVTCIKVQGTIEPVRSGDRIVYIKADEVSG